MKKTVVKYGLLGGGLIILLFTISYLFLETLTYAQQEVFGYLSIFVALIFVFFGIKSYRDNENDQSITFGRALGLGVLITLIPSFIFGLFDVIYILYLNPDFFETAYAAHMAELGKNLSGEELKTAIAEAESMKTMAMNPLFSFLLMFFTVFILGFIISLISAVILRKAPQQG